MKKAPLSVRIIQVLTTIVFWLMIVLTSVIFIANLIFMTGIIDEEFGLRVMLPVTFSLEETGTMPLFDGVNEVRIEQAMGKIHIVNTPMSFTKMVSKVLFVVVAIGLFMTWKFKRFIDNIKTGKIFDKGNIDNLKHISLGLVGLYVVTKIYMTVFYQYAVRLIDYPSVNFTSEFIDLDPMIAIAILLWVLAHAFSKGYELQQENDLMV
jgi:hypothetical protein